MHQSDNIVLLRETENSRRARAARMLSREIGSGKIIEFGTRRSPSTEENPSSDEKPTIDPVKGPIHRVFPGI